MFDQQNFEYIIQNNTISFSYHADWLCVKNTFQNAIYFFLFRVHIVSRQSIGICQKINSLSLGYESRMNDWKCWGKETMKIWILVWKGTWIKHFSGFPWDKNCKSFQIFFSKISFSRHFICMKLCIFCVNNVSSIVLTLNSVSLWLWMGILFLKLAKLALWMGNQPN